MNAYITAKAAAELTGRSEKTIRNWIRAGKLRATKGGRDFRIELEELARVCPLVAAPAPAVTPPEAGLFPPPLEDNLPEAADVLAAVVRLIDALGDRDRQLTQLYAERAELAGQVQDLQARLRALEEDVRRLLEEPRGSGAHSLLPWRRASR